ncbi:MAG: hypothetical protein KAH34_14535 [Ketobacter sp.]|nr:hypothetical protein [Ketobacter sp.]
MSDDENVVQFGSAKERFVHERKAQAAKDLRKQFQTAMGWKKQPKSKKSSASKGPKLGRGKKR